MCLTSTNYISPAPHRGQTVNDSLTVAQRSPLARVARTVGWGVNTRISPDHVPTEQE